MTVIIRDCKHYKVAEKQLQILLGFVEEDIHDHTKQGAAFPLLKVILSFSKLCKVDWVKKVQRVGGFVDLPL